MADISKISLPSGTEYNLKDASARSGLTGKQDVIDIDGIIGNSGSFTNVAEDWGYSLTDLQSMSVEELVGLIADIGVNSPEGSAGTVTSVGLTNATNGGLSISGSPITSSGTITIGHSNVLPNAYTSEAILPIAIDKNGHITSYGTAITPMTSLLVGAEVKSGTSTTSWTSSVYPNQYYWIHPGNNISLESYSVTGTINKTGVTINAIVPTNVSDLTNDSGYITLNDIPTIPTIKLNGVLTTTPEFYAPTSAGTSGYYLKSNGSGAPTWAEVTAGISDVTVAGTSVVTNSVAVIAAPVQIVRW